MGIFLHALDARTGEVLWTNEGEGSVYMKQPHQADAFAAIASQGAQVVVGDKLLVPGGRSVPACYDRKTGKRLYYHLADHSKIGGGAEVVANDKVFVNGGAAFDVRTGYYLGHVGDPVVLTPDVLYAGTGAKCRALDLAHARLHSDTASTRSGKWGSRASWKIDPLGSVTVPPLTASGKKGDGTPRTRGPVPFFPDAVNGRYFAERYSTGEIKGACATNRRSHKPRNDGSLIAVPWNALPGKRKPAWPTS
jgi:outer membrane protein assembly factor BamB